MADHKNKPRFGSLQPDVEDILHWNDLTDSDFSKASAAEKEGLRPMRPPKKQPKVAPTKNEGTISPPLKPAPMVTAVKTILSAKASGSAWPAMACWITGTPAPR